MPSQLFDICSLISPRVVVSRGIIHLEAVAGVVGPRREQPARSAMLGRRAARAGRGGRPLCGRGRAHLWN